MQANVRAERPPQTGTEKTKQKLHENQARAHGEEKTHVKAHQTMIKHKKPQKQEKNGQDNKPMQWGRLAMPHKPKV